jgi:hypothetical protein
MRTTSDDGEHADRCRGSLLAASARAFLAVMLQQNGTHIGWRPAGGAMARLRDARGVCCFGPASSERGTLTGWSATVALGLSSARWRGADEQYGCEAWAV